MYGQQAARQGVTGHVSVCVCVCLCVSVCLCVCASVCLCVSVGGSWARRGGGCWVHARLGGRAWNLKRCLLLSPCSFGLTESQTHRLTCPSYCTIYTYRVRDLELPPKQGPIDPSDGCKRHWQLLRLCRMGPRVTSYEDPGHDNRNPNIEALIITNAALGVPYYIYTTVAPKPYSSY